MLYIDHTSGALPFGVLSSDSTTSCTGSGVATSTDKAFSSYMNAVWTYLGVPTSAMPTTGSATCCNYSLCNAPACENGVEYKHCPINEALLGGH